MNTFKGIDTDQNKETEIVYKLIKNVFIIVCLIACGYQIASIVTMYLKYPYVSTVIRKPMQKLYVPGVTLCNSNRIRRSQLSQIEKLSDFDWSTFDSPNISRIEEQRKIDNVLKKLIKEKNISDFMTLGHTYDGFIVMNYTLCASDKLYPTTTCKDSIDVITTVTDEGNCFTLFHKSKSKDLRDVAMPPGYAQVPIKGGRDSVRPEISEQTIHPNEVLRLKLDFQRQEYVTLNEPVMGQIVVHDDNEVPIVREKSFVIEPGNYYEFYMIKELSVILPKPYDTDCKVYRVKQTENYNPFLHNPLSKSDCKIGCMAQHTMDLCDCWPPEVPFIRGTLETAQENRMKWCDWNNAQLRKKVANNGLKDEQEVFDYCFADYEEECDTKCNNNCVLKFFKITKDVRTWPSEQRINYSEKGEELTRMRNCCAIISIRYWGNLLSVNEFQPKLLDIEFMSYIGGLLSMWIGFSFLSFYNLIEGVIKYMFLNIKIKNQNKKIVKRRPTSDFWNHAIYGKNKFNLFVDDFKPKHFDPKKAYY